jgi:hypothetical protein
MTTNDEWLRRKGLTIAELLNGRYRVDDEAEVHRVFYTPWNNILEANGLDRTFSEEPIGEALLESVKQTIQSLGATGSVCELRSEQRPPHSRQM